MPSFAKRWSGCNQPLAGLFTNPLMLSIFAEAVALSCGGEEARFSVPCPGETCVDEVTIVADIISQIKVVTFDFFNFSEI